MCEYLLKNPKFIKESSKSWVFTKNLLENCQYEWIECQPFRQPEFKSWYHNIEEEKRLL